MKPRVGDDAHIVPQEGKWGDVGIAPYEYKSNHPINYNLKIKNGGVTAV